jgi:hypothetical protein
LGSCKTKGSYFLLKNYFSKPILQGVSMAKLKKFRQEGNANHTSHSCDLAATKYTVCGELILMFTELYFLKMEL